MPQWGRSQERNNDEKPSIRVDIDLMEAVAVLVARIFTVTMGDGLVPISPL
jgi:hypothetical protein